MQGQTEVALKLDREDLIEYWTSAVPRVGDTMDLSYEDIEGVYLVKQVTHTVFEDKYGYILNYVTVNLELDF